MTMFRAPEDRRRSSGEPAWARPMCLGAVLASLLSGCTGPSPEPPPPASCETAPSDASAFIVLPDTQYYACAYPEILRAQTQWIVEQQDTTGIGLVVHTGDIVDRNDDVQWQRAADALHLLDGTVPYLLTAGNHDIDGNRRSQLNRHFVSEDLSLNGCAQMGLREPGRLENAFALVKLRGRPFIFVALEFGPRDAVLDWAGEVLREHADVPAVVFTHAYLYDDEARYDRMITPPQPYHPDKYQITPSEGIGDGQDIWETLVETHENVRLVLSGHVIPDGVARRSPVRSTGTVVHEVLANYQTCGACPCEEVEGGGGYLRVFALDEDGASLRVSTYSPHTHEYKDDPDNSFVLEL